MNTRIPVATDGRRFPFWVAGRGAGNALTLPTGEAGRLARKLWSEVKSNSRDYFPMQNVLKIKFNMSSFVVAPVIASNGRRAPL